MADNTTLSTGAGGDVMRDKDRAGVKTTIVGLDLGIGGGVETSIGALFVASAITATAGSPGPSSREPSPTAFARAERTLSTSAW